MPVESWRYESRRERRRRQIAALQDSVSRSLEPFYRGDYGAARQAFRGEEPEPVEPLRFDLPEAETGEPGRRMAPGWGGAIGKITQDVAGGVREPGTLPKRDKGVGGILSKIGAAFDAVTPDALEPVGRKALEYADKPREYVGGPLFSLLTGATGVESQVDPETGQRYRSKPGFGDVLSGLGEAFTRNPIETYQEGRQAANERLADPELSAFERTLLGGFSDPLSYIGVGAVNRGLRFLPEAVRASRGFRAGAALVESPGRASAGGVIGAGLGAQFAEEAGADSRGTLLATLGGGLVGGGLASSLTPERVTRGIDRITDLEGRLTAEPELGELSMYARTGDYPQASRQIGGLEVWDEDGIPNQASIGASLGEYEVLPGIRTLPLSDFDAAPRDLFYAADDLRAVRHLAGQISESGRIKPLIVVIDAEGPYILEGAHRLGALHELGVTEFPALVVKDLEAIGPESGTLRMRPKARIGAKGALPRLRPEEVAADRALGLPDYSAADVLTLPKLEAKPRSRLQTIVDTMKSTLGMTPDDTVAAPAMRARERLKPVVESQANRLAAVADNIANTAFRRDADGRIQDIVGNPTVQHLAARLPEYEPFMTTAQKAAMARLRAEVEPYRRLLAEAGVEYGSRADVMEGGFYLPRGRADLEGADAPVGRRGGGRAGSKQGFQKGAEFETMLAGIDAGYEYAPFAEAMRSYAEQAGRAAVDKHVADYFKSLVARNASDFEGRLAGESLGSTPSDRMDPVVRARWQDLAAQLVSARARLRTLEKRAKVALTASDEVDDAIQQWEQGLPDSGTGGIARIGSALEGEAQRGQQLRQQAADMGDDYGAKLSHLSGQAYELERVVKRLDEIVPPDVDKLGKLETALRRTVKRAEQMADRGVEYRDEALKVRDEIDHILDAVDELRPEYQRALEKSRATPRGEAAIDMAPLSGMTFPEALANAANKFLKAEKPASGRNTGTLVAVQAFNQLLRGMRATADISFMGIQGAIGAARNPVAYASALHAAIRSMADGDFLGAFIRDFDADAVKRGRPTSREWAARGLRVSGNQHEFAIGRGLGAVGDRIQSLPVVKQSNRAFGNFGDALRLKLADASYGSSRMVGFDMAEAANLESVADAVNRATGWSRSRFAGDVGELAMFAPRFFQSQIEFLAQAAAGGGPGAWEARRMLLQFTGAGVMVTLLANEFSDNPIPTEELFDPTSGNFMRFRWGGQDISVFGPWDSLVRGVVNTVRDGDPSYVLRSKASPAVSLAWNVISGETFTGEPARTPGALLRELVVPFSLSDSAIFGGDKGLSESLVGMTGLKSTPMTPSEELDTLARAQFGKGFYDLAPADQKAIKDAHPEVWERAVERGSKLRVANEEVKQRYRQEQEQRDARLLAGEITLEQWEKARQDARAMKAGEQAQIYRDTSFPDRDSVMDAYYGQIDAATVDGVTDWDAVDAWLDGQSDADRAEIDRNTGLNDTPMQALRRRLSKEYYALPRYRGYSADEAREIDALWQEVRNNARGSDTLYMLRALRKADTSGYSEKAVRGVRRRILGMLREDRSRERYRRDHPEVLLLNGSGRLTPDMAAVLEAANQVVEVAGPR